MRDLGLMGENIFSLWCAEAGLIPNSSQIDKTGWDFFVEFPYESGTFSSPTEVHKAAFECKVQVKATDKNDRKLPITLSNLRRLATVQMPAFFVFIEFDGTSTAQRAFVVHLDNNLITKVLKRLHELEESEEENKFNKRKMTIHYDESHMLSVMNGNCLKEKFLSHIGEDISEYILNKKSHLESTGFENGKGKFTFTTEKANVKDLIDSSLGLEKEVNISNIQNILTRFGIESKAPFLNSKEGKITISPSKPIIGTICIKKDSLSPEHKFSAKLYNSSFNALVPKELVKMRIVGDFFDITFNPFTGAANFSYSFNEEIRLEIKKFMDALKFVKMLSSNEEYNFELIFEGFPRLKLKLKGNGHGFTLTNELKTLEYADKISSYFEVSNIDISFDEIVQNDVKITQMFNLIHAPEGQYTLVFSTDGDKKLDTDKDTCVISLLIAHIGNKIFGLIFVLFGRAKEKEESEYELTTNNIIFEKKICVEKDDYSHVTDELIAEVEKIEKKYDNDYSVVTLRR